MPSVGSWPVVFVMFPAGLVMTKPCVPEIAAMADSMSDRFIVPPGAPLDRNIPEIAAEIAARLVELELVRFAIVKLIGFAIGAHAYTSAVTGCIGYM